MSAKVLCVDDEPNILLAFRRQLRQFDLETAVGPEAGLAVLEAKGPFAIVVSDLRMPVMDGVQFLTRVRAASPNTIRIMLTGQADLTAASMAVNEGCVFRFLLKPCPPEVLSLALQAGLEQFRLVSAERDLLEQELRRRETRLAKIKMAKKVIEQRAREKAAAEGKSTEEAKRGKPDAKDQYNFTDPESRIMKGADGFVQAYNAQASVEPEMMLIVGQSVTEAANDKQQLAPMVVAIEQQSGQRPEAILADSGYCSEENLAHLESAEWPERKIEGFIATGKQPHGEPRLPCKPGPLPKGATRVERMKRKLQTKVGKAVYATRKCVVEPVFGQIKQARGFRQFLLRGKTKIRGEWALVCLTHNILRLHAALQGY